VKFDRDSNADSDRTGTLGGRGEHMADADRFVPHAENLWEEKQMDPDSIGTRGAADIR
jgi:hypothetical protein